MSSLAFEDWAVEQIGLTDEDVTAIKLMPAFDLFVSRLEAARDRGASDPLQTITAKQAGGNSRACTKRMLEQLGFTPAARRAVHRLLAGSPSGWPGLLRLYASEANLTAKERQYAKRQVATLLRSHHESESRRGAKAA
jgi:hypothetical protein